MGAVYEIPVALVPNTAASSPVIVRQKLIRGVLGRVTIEFPKGCAGLVGVRVYIEEQQILPVQRDRWLVSDGAILEYEPELRLDYEPVTLTVRAYNTDDTYTHTPIVRVEHIAPGSIFADSSKAPVPLGIGVG